MIGGGQQRIADLGKVENRKSAASHALVPIGLAAGEAFHQVTYQNQTVCHEAESEIEGRRLGPGARHHEETSISSS